MKKTRGSIKIHRVSEKTFYLSNKICSHCHFLIISSFMRLADAIKEDDSIIIYSKHNNKGAMHKIYDTGNKRTLWYRTFKSKCFLDYPMCKPLLVDKLWIQIIYCLVRTYHCINLLYSWFSYFHVYNSCNCFSVVTLL